MTATSNPTKDTHATAGERWKVVDCAPFSVWCGDTQIASCRWTEDDGALGDYCERSELKAIANARLISAAPDLYEALNKLTEAFAQTYIERSAADADPRIIAARAAIAKSEGRP